MNSSLCVPSGGLHSTERRRSAATRAVKALATGAVTGAALFLASPGALAQDMPDTISGSAGVSYNTHFISYGADVWGGGDDFFGDRSTTFVWADMAIAISPVTINLGVWSDVNNNVPSAIGGNLQEVDVYAGLTYAAGPLSIGATYQRWMYAGDVEEIVDLSLGFNDMGMIAPNFALNPKVVWHIRTSGNGAQPEGSALVFSVGPTFPLGNGNLSLTIPAGIALFLDDDFQFGTESGYAYSYLGASLGIPLSFVPATYGVWTANVDLIGYFTDSKAIPNNPEENFLTASVGIKVAY